MTEENTTEEVKVSDILRQTAINSNELMLKIADHIDRLEANVLALQERIVQLEGPKE
jgi:hypothetical protein